MSTELDALVHDVRSRCSSLQSAAALLKAAPPQEAAELLTLMTQQAGKLIESLARYRQESGA